MDSHTIKDSDYASVQVHKHTFTCYKYDKTIQDRNLCRFNIPFWPSNSTWILSPLAKNDSRRKFLKEKSSQMKKLLEKNSHRDIEDFLSDANIDHETYSNVIRASLKRPTIIFKRKMNDIWTNTFNPWIANALKANMDLQFVLDKFSVGAYVVEYINKSNRGISNLHKQLCDLQEEFPDQNYLDLLKRLSINLLNKVEMASQEHGICCANQ